MKVLPVALVILIPLTSIGEAPSRVAGQLEVAANLEAQDKLHEALKTYEDLLRSGDVSSHEEGAIRLRTARLRAEATPTDRRQVTADLRRAAELATPEIQRSALNDLGVFLLESGRPEEALAVMQELELRAQLVPTLRAQERAVYAFNLGRALQASGDSQAAFWKYHFAAQTLPTFEKPINGALAVLTEQRPPRIAQAQVLLGGLTAVTPRAVRAGVKKLVIAWKDAPETADLLPILARAIVRQGVTVEDFLTEDWPALSQGGSEGGHYRAMLQEMRVALRGELAFEEFEAFQNHAPAFNAWPVTGMGGTAFRDLLFYAAQAAEKSGRRDAAIMLYANAWARNWNDLDPPARLAELLQTHTGPDTPYSSWLRGVIERLFQMKWGAHMDGAVETKLRLHVALGMIFARDPNSALVGTRSFIYQYEQALALEQRLRELDPQRPQPTGLQMLLADAYVARKMPEGACSHYLDAGKVLLQQDQFLESSRAITKCRNALPRDSKHHSRLEKTEELLAKLSGPEQVCQGVLVDTRANPRNCGKCGNMCAETMTCREGACIGDSANNPH
ncbi:hypothetical protein MFUL124B02_21205 [Myxococcus fulvus 124B02]|nr:hypothetical protein MFUL124B02_21205 [Myxococcus fulvus 124B02]